MLFGFYALLDIARIINPIPDKIEVISYVKTLESSITFPTPFNSKRTPRTIREILIILFIIFLLSYK
jgi:hypothetical protein